MLHYVASDAHNLRGRASHMGECCEYLKKHMGRLYTSRIMRDNPSKIVETLSSHFICRKQRKQVEIL